MWVQSLGQEDPLEKEMTTHSRILEKSQRQRSLAGCSPWNHKESETWLRQGLNQRDDRRVHHFQKRTNWTLIFGYEVQRKVSQS